MPVGRAGFSSRLGFDLVTLHTEDFHQPLRNKVDVVILATDVRLPAAGGRGGRGGAPRRRMRRPAAGRPVPAQAGVRRTACRACRTGTGQAIETTDGRTT